MICNVDSRQFFDQTDIAQQKKGTLPGPRGVAEESKQAFQDIRLWAEDIIQKKRLLDEHSFSELKCMDLFPYMNLSRMSDSQLGRFLSYETEPISGYQVAGCTHLSIETLMEMAKKSKGMKALNLCGTKANRDIVVLFAEANKGTLKSVRYPSSLEEPVNGQSEHFGRCLEMQCNLSVEFPTLEGKAPVLRRQDSYETFTNVLKLLGQPETITKDMIDWVNQSPSVSYKNPPASKQDFAAPPDQDRSDALAHEEQGIELDESGEESPRIIRPCQPYRRDVRSRFRRFRARVFDVLAQPFRRMFRR